MAITGSDEAQLTARLAVLRLGTGRLDAILPVEVVAAETLAVRDAPTVVRYDLKLVVHVRELVTMEAVTG